MARGDHRAFERFYDTLSPAVYGLLSQLLHNTADVEEVAQETFVDIWRSAPRFTPDRGSPLAWAMTLAHRRAIDRMRSTRSSAARETLFATRSYSRPFDHVSEEVLSRREKQQVRQCLSTLTELQRQSVLLTYYRGHTYRQAAVLLRSPHATIKTRIRDGLIRLRDCLAVSKSPPA